MLDVKNLNSFYGRSKAIQDLSIKVLDGAVFAVLGRNGVGKTTLLRTILGLTDRCEGSIKLNGNEITDKPTFERARAGVAYVPQGRMIIPDFSIKDNILMGGFASSKGRKIPDLVAELFPYLMENLERPGGVLSGGQQQQLAIARALASDPKLLLMDEPTEGIQPNIVEQIEECITRLNRELKLTIVLVEQNVDFARKAASHFAMIENGTCKVDGKIEALTAKIVSQYMTI